ncbi:NAD(P)/FAD-dependent oxidoreductase [Pseudonocardia sp. KRD-184]|uniref:NAD(P)/FAD-dependent oxidoreductase n=1 Tax=Pseudonocardia oceani TaxID=2792013 RepID=A0ABS6UDF0_9PSEU|nr:NAD(P)/FAD-dependent oxidoreductase [Pseudonocardia oceani]MBW0089703.1 NAD(P)/FAD-dependent oxidoreductase [Pseudonocardia oceani]MBW0097130.1 NAD(P)/FAD-dependent oxidoreductase [Pseudonocardia oceani]MBW0111920.1 NAD(P)/FAD-dependent oxidoreductase [Pseudonocardia oceani]MBW0123394.1 NAD(P)/FAD-dependent oxidoreductase [Pseudonocardia oceani]MBW0130269.1 NAD(P)/FAD-dependent oxidoreductase [Pseudonocardia oceani]
MTDQTVDVAIVGSGFAGLGAAVTLAQAGRTDVVILEKGSSVGGTWRDNTYPGCACDVQSHLYSFSFAPNPDWTRTFARQPEIRAYLESIVDRFDLRGKLRFGREVTAMEWDGARWAVTTADGSVVHARAVVWGTGPLHLPSTPEIEGVEEFRGTVFHSSRWDHGHDLRGRRVAVIGTGASAIQFVPHIQREVASLTLFQRTAPWVLPKPDRPIPAPVRALYKRVPLAQKIQRSLVYARNEMLVGGFLKPARMKVIEAFARLYLDRTFADRPDLKATLTPDFTIGCKRILMSNDYYSALKQPNVHVVTDGITRVTPTGVVTADGVEHEVDSIIFGTGFRVGESLRDVAVTGRDGVKLADEWADGPQAHLGTTVAGFPNLFLMIGPNTGLGHSSMVFMIESQTRFILDALALLDTHGATAIDTRRDRQDAFNAEVQRRLQGSVWNSGGCRSWYLDAAGNNRTVWPGYTFDYRRRVRKVHPADHELVS